MSASPSQNRGDLIKARVPQQTGANQSNIQDSRNAERTNKDCAIPNRRRSSAQENEDLYSLISRRNDTESVSKDANMKLDTPWRALNTTNTRRRISAPITTRPISAVCTSKRKSLHHKQPMELNGSKSIFATAGTNPKEPINAQNMHCGGAHKSYLTDPMQHKSATCALAKSDKLRTGVIGKTRRLSEFTRGEFLNEKL